VEDRQTEGLYLELGSVDARTYAARAAELGGRPGVSRVTWWANCAYERSDLPRKVPDGTMLGVAEVQGPFVAPGAAAGTIAHHFRRHRRPSQGIITGRPTTGLMIVWISPREPGLAQALRDWGDFVHIRHIAAAGIPGFTQISVYENVEPGDPRYLHFYEFDGEDPEATFATMNAFVGPRLGGLGSPAYTEWADWRRAGGRLFYCNTFRLMGETRSR